MKDSFVIHMTIHSENKRMKQTERETKQRLGTGTKTGVALLPMTLFDKIRVVSVLCLKNSQWYLTKVTTSMSLAISNPPATIFSGRKPHLPPKTIEAALAIPSRMPCG